MGLRRETSGTHMRVPLKRADTSSNRFVPLRVTALALQPMPPAGSKPVGYSFRLTSSFRLRRLQRVSSVRSRRALRRSASGDGGAAGAFSGLRASWVACRVCGLSALYFI
jgi:hypothetical protein